VRCTFLYIIKCGALVLGAVIFAPWLSLGRIECGGRRGHRRVYENDGRHQSVVAVIEEPVNLPGRGHV